MRGFRSIIRQIATGLAGGGVFHGNDNREVITVPFLTVYGMDTNFVHEPLTKDGESVGLSPYCLNRYANAYVVTDHQYRPTVIRNHY